MRAAIQIGETVSVLQGWEWQSEDDEMDAMLNSMIDPDGPSPSDPQPQINEAHRMADMFEGKVILEEPWVNNDPPGVIY